MRKPAPKAQIRCAVYTRKSTEDGLEQEYNSLDAQYDACASYIASQRQEGWRLLPDRYDDGGFSGGNMDRPGLKRLMADVAAGKIDTIVIYKVDRLTRSLSDFAKIVEVLDDKEASFVSVTQAFNTTTSMGRLTLNMLLSFAQFEREVTGERIRDKIAASKRKGLWMGGPVPLGYDVQDRKLVANDAEAELVRHIFASYLTSASVTALAQRLNGEGHRTKLQNRASGPHKGGCMFRRGTLYHLLSNRIYLGDIVHKGEAHRGEHPPIIAQELWDKVQARLADRGRGAIGRQSTERRSHLIGLLFDGQDRAMTPSHSKKGNKRYRYYVTREPSPEQPAWRVSAHDLEQLVTDRVAALLLDRNGIARAVLAVEPRKIDAVAAAAAAMASDRTLLSRLPEIGIERIDLTEDQLTITVREYRLLVQLGIALEENDSRILLTATITRVRRGHELRLVVPSQDEAPAPKRDEKLVALLGEALAARELVLSEAPRSINQIATRHKRCRTRLARLVRLSWMAPDLVRAIASGSIAPELTSAELLATELPVPWRDQTHALRLA